MNWTRIPHTADLVTLEDVDVWTTDSIRRSCDLLLREGRLIEIRTARTPRSRSERIAILPAAVDTQVHMRTPGQWEKETPETAALAALRGGVGAVLTMPNTKPVLDSVQALELAKKLVTPAADRFGIRVLFSVAGTVGQKGEAVSPLEELVAAGAVAVTDDGRGVENDGLQGEIFRRLEKLGIPFLQHAETAGAEGPLAEGPVTRKLGLKPYRAEHETDMVARDIKSLEATPAARYHLLHTSAAGSVGLIRAAKSRGLKVTAEVSPHHLFFSSDDIDENNTAFKMNPPIRSIEDREALIDALADGTIDWVATDHAPHEVATKSRSFPDATFGTLGLETMVPVVLHLVARGRLTPMRAVEVLSQRPAQFMGIEDEFGHLKVGAPLRACIVAPQRAWTVRAGEHASLSKNTCFDGVRLTGQVLGQINGSGMWLSNTFDGASARN